MNMRKVFLTFLLVLMSFSLSWAQDDGFTKNSPVGTVGIIGGREAMVVDLGGNIGKVAVATKNVGANSCSDYGIDFDVDDVNNPSKNGLTNDWYVPSKDELDALFGNLSFNEARTGLEWKVTANSTLQIPGREFTENYGDVYGYSGWYLTSTLENGKYASWAFQIDNRGTAVSMPGSVQAGGGTWWCHIRPFHKLIDLENVKAAAKEAIEALITGTTDEVAIYYCNSYIRLLDSASTTDQIAALVAKAEYAIANQDEETTLTLSFTGEGMPVEGSHELEGLQIFYSEDGEEMELHVNGAEVTYQLDNVSGVTYFRGIPSVSLTANQDPGNAGNYYTTFYSGLEAYTLPEGVKAYTAKMEDSGNETVVRLTTVTGDILPQGEAVLLYTTDGNNITMNVADGNGVDKADVNMFHGVDVATQQAGTNNYMLSYGQNGLGFYKMNSSTLLAANKAFLPQPANNAKAMRMVFDDGTTGISIISVNDTLRYDDNNIYSVSGIRLNQLQKGINIVNGKKIIVK